MTIASAKITKKGDILVVDDEPDVRIAVTTILDCEGYHCESVASAGEAIEALHRYPIDLVLTDMHLEGSSCSGLELIDQIRQIDETIPIILVTGYPSISMAVDAMRRGAVEYLAKPFDRDKLLHMIAKALQERRLRMDNHRLQAEANKAAVIEKLNRELNNRINELTSLYIISEGLAQFLDTESLFDRIVQLAAQVTGAQRISVMLLDRHRTHLKIRSALGIAPEVVARTVTLVGDGIVGKVAQTGKSIRISRTLPRSPLPRPDETTPCYATQSWLSMPLKIGDEIFGVINLTDKLDGSDFTREDEQLMNILVEKAGIKLENQALYEGIYSNLVDTLTSLVTTLEAKDPYTRQHSQRVTEYSLALGRIMNLPDDQLEMLQFAGVLHDIGKIGVREEILLKAGRLTDDEYTSIKQHPIIGEKIVAPLGLVSEEKGIIRHHHERYDGRGYPDGLGSGDIPLMARIVAVTDAFDAMTTTRSYRRALAVDLAVNELRRCSGSQFDPSVVEALLVAISQSHIVVPSHEEPAVV